MNVSKVFCLTFRWLLYNVKCHRQKHSGNIATVEIGSVSPKTVFVLQLVKWKIL